MWESLMKVRYQNVALIVYFCKLLMDTLPFKHLAYEAHVQHIFPNKQTKKQSHPQRSDPSSRGSQHVSHSLICPDQSNIRKPPLVEPGDAGTRSTVQTDPGAEGPSYTPLFLPALGSWRHMAHSHIYY